MIDARVARVGSEGNFGGDFGGRPRRIFSDEQDALPA